MEASPQGHIFDGLCVDVVIKFPQFIVIHTVKGFGIVDKATNCCFLTCIQISQEAGKVVCYSHLFKNSLQFIVICIVKGFGIIYKAEVDVVSGILLLSL